MGQYHYQVNLDKKEVVHPHQIGNGLKLVEQISWPYATATALVMLLASSSRNGGRGGGDFRSGHPLIGSWAGKRIAFIGDYAESCDVFGCDAKLIFEQCSTATAGPEDSLTKPPPGWQEWTNISAQVREMMAAEFCISYTGDGWMDIIKKPIKTVGG